MTPFLELQSVSVSRIYVQHHGNYGHYKIFGCVQKLFLDINAFYPNFSLKYFIENCKFQTISKIFMYGKIELLMLFLLVELSEITFP